MECSCAVLPTWSSSDVEVLGAGVGTFFDDPDDPEEEGVTTIREPVDTL